MMKMFKMSDSDTHEHRLKFYFESEHAKNHELVIAPFTVHPFWILLEIHFKVLESALESAVKRNASMDLCWNSQGSDGQWNRKGMEWYALERDVQQAHMSMLGQMSIYFLPNMTIRSNYISENK